VDGFCSDWGVSIRRVLEMDTSTYQYKSRRREQAGIEARIREICETRVRYGYRRVHVLLCREGWAINMKRTPRIYNELGLQLRNTTRKRRVKAKLRGDRYAASRVNDVCAMDLWAYANSVTLDFSRPGEPTDNAYIEAFNGRFRAECLNTHWFLTLADAREKLEKGRRYYNEDRPPGAIGNKPPITLVNPGDAPSPSP
jgi:putative transposase